MVVISELEIKIGGLGLLMIQLFINQSSAGSVEWKMALLLAADFAHSTMLHLHQVLVVHFVGCCQTKSCQK